MSFAGSQENEDTMMVLKFFVFMSILVMLKQLFMFTGVGVNLLGKAATYYDE